MMQNAQKKALIIGTGIAGPTLALFLKCAGIEAEIYEAREMPEGYSLSLSCNGVAVLAELGLDGPVFAQGSAVTKWHMWNGKGKQLGEGILASENLKSVFIKRIPLGKILSDEAERQGMKIVRGKKLEHIEERYIAMISPSFGRSYKPWRLPSRTLCPIPCPSCLQAGIKDQSC